MKIYTRSGDRGTTSLFSGERVRKDDPRIEAYGDVDELNSTIGALIAALRRDGGPAASEPGTSEAGALGAELEAVQADLLRAGGWLSCSAGAASAATLPAFAGAEAPAPADDPVARLEQAIDRHEARLAPLRRFILPGGHPSAAWAHLARCVCRRAERRVLALVERGEELPASGADAPVDRVVSEQRRVLVYLNRLSDYLFVVARTCNRLAGCGDRPWEP